MQTVVLVTTLLILSRRIPNIFPLNLQIKGCDDNYCNDSVHFLFGSGTG
jgi:hypothetical protein